MRELARLLGMTPGFVTNWERGLRLPKPEDVGAVLAHCRVIGDDRRRIVEMARGAREQDWIDSGGEEAYLEWERTAEAVFGWEPEVVPRLLQTSAYAKAVQCGSLGAVASAAASRASPVLPVPASPELPESLESLESPLEPLVESRLARCEAPESGPRCVQVLGEAALRGRIGGPGVMAEQVRYLAALLSEGRVDLRVVPAGSRPDLARGFTIFDFADLPSIVHERLLRESASSSSPARVAKYREVAETLLALAMPKAAAQTLLTSVIRELSVPWGRMGGEGRGEG